MGAGVATSPHCPSSMARLPARRPAGRVGCARARPASLPVMPVGEAPKRRPFLQRSRREPKPEAVPAGLISGRSRRRSRSTAPSKASPRRCAPPSPKRGRFPASFAAFGSRWYVQKRASSRLLSRFAGCRTRFGFRRRTPGFPLAPSGPLPQPLSRSRGGPEPLRFGVSPSRIPRRFLRVARSGYGSDAVTLCESYQADSPCG
jgi:hypothetical protein